MPPFAVPARAAVDPTPSTVAAATAAAALRITNDSRIRPPCFARFLRKYRLGEPYALS